jgi:PDZ domain-containing secreted protein/HAMP domain-containing protein
VEAEIRGLANDYARGATPALASAIEQRLAAPQGRDAVYLLADATGQRIAGNLGRWPPTVAPDAGWTTLELYRTDRSGPTEISALALRLPRGEMLLVGRDVAARATFDRTLARALLWALVAIAALALATGWLVSRLVGSRVDEIGGAARDIMAGALDRRVALRGTGDEFDRLAGTLNAMLDRIEALVQGLRTVTDSLAHDLRSPLGRLIQHLEAATEEARPEVRQGRIARALTEAETMNPVFLLDEMDKVGADWRGDPSSALLEVLDPAQNHTFRDHYLEVDLDLSDVLFIATANVVETIPGPLLDRTEVIRIDGYTDREKVEIARDHLLPRQLRNAGLEPEELTVSEDALAAIVDRYTREAGVRNLERELGKLSRKVATSIASKKAPDVVEVDEDEVKEYLGKPKIWKDEATDRTDVPGVATGLAVTGAGGDVLFIEASTMEGERGLTLTGQLGDVMKESAQIALSYVEAHADELGIDSGEMMRGRYHVHVPAGAIPKDGPSAGVAMLTALVSLLSGRKVKDTVGMTGEITLQGKVLPIGGVKQKVLAAHRAGLTEVILPRRNEQDLDDVPEQVRDDMTFHIADTAADVLEHALS